MTIFQDAHSEIEDFRIIMNNMIVIYDVKKFES